MKIRARLLILVFAFFVNTVILFALPFIKYLDEAGIGGEDDGITQEVEITKVNLTEKKKEVKKIKLKNSRPKVTRKTQADSSRFKLDFGSGGFGEGASLSSQDSANIIYDENSVDIDPVRISGRDPVVPDVFASSGLDGRVELQIVIEASGKVSQLKVILEEPANYQLGRAASAAVRTWKYRPATIKSIPVRIRVIVPFVFL